MNTTTAAFFDFFVKCATVFGGFFEANTFFEVDGFLLNKVFFLVLKVLDRFQSFTLGIREII